MRPSRLHMSIRKVFAVLVALSVLFAPSAAAAAHQAAMSGQHMHMMEMGHCDGLPSKGDHDKAPGTSCCISMCMAVGISPQGPVSSVQVEDANSYFAVATSWHGYLGEIATPPPRSA
jgi:hypothetical protein